MKRLILIICIIFSCIVGYSQQKTHDDMSVSIEFIVNTNTIIHNSGYNYYINTIIPYLRKNVNDLDRILLVGSASPEGNKEGNIRLANIRADKIYSYIKNFIPRNKIEINNDYDLFLSKTGLDESNWSKLRATYVEIVWKNKPIEVKQKIDTIYKDRVDTIYKEIEKPIILEKIVREKDTVYIDKPIKKSCDKLVFSPYNNLAANLIKAHGIGLEFYFYQMSFFVEGNFANTTLTGKKFTYDLWHTGFRKYFNDNYDKIFIEVYGRTGYFDMDIFGDEPGKFGVPFGVGIGLGWKFSLCSHVKLYPFIRFGYDYIKFMDYYYSETGVGNVGVTFNQYTDYKDNTSEKTNTSVIEYTPENRVINREFFEKAKTLHWFGPSYIGLVIQLDLHKRK